MGRQDRVVEEFFFHFQIRLIKVLVSVNKEEMKKFEVFIQETTLASHLAKSQQDTCAYKILEDGRFGKIAEENLARPIICKIEQEDLSSTCKINQDLCLARLRKMMLANCCKNDQDRDLARLIKIEQDFLARLSKIQLVLVYLLLFAFHRKKFIVKQDF